MAKVPQHPVVTPEQIQLWEANPVTKAYLQCLEWFKQDIADLASNGGVADSSSADLTHAMLHRNYGQQDGLADAANYNYLLDRHGMILEPKKEDDDVED